MGPEHTESNFRAPDAETAGSLNKVAGGLEAAGALLQQVASGSRALDAEAIRTIRTSVEAAKQRGWLQPDLKRWFATLGVEFAAYKAGLTGEPLAHDVFHALAAISVHGLPDLPYAPNLEAIREHLEWLAAPARGAYDDALLEIAYEPAPGGGPTTARLFGLDELPEAVAFAAATNAQRRNVYVGAALRLPDAARDRRASGEDFYVATAVPIDIDQNYGATRAAMAAVCDDGLVVTTGLTPERRSQHWVRLAEPCDSDLEFAHAFRGLVEHVGADMAVKDAARVMRLGGTVAFPNERKVARGYCTELTAVAVNPAARPSDLAVFRALAASPAAEGRRDFSDRPQADGIERGGFMGGGKVVNGRERFFATKLLPRCIREFQEGRGRDPTADELFAAAFSMFCDEADNSDERWTSADGQRQLRARASNTLRRLRVGRLAHIGLYSVETGVGKEEAEASEAAYQANRTGGRKSSGADTDREEPAQLFDPWATFAVPLFPLDTLPPVLRRYVTVKSQLIGVDPAATAMTVLAVLSGAVDHRFALKLKQHDEWWASPRLWVVLVGDPSTKKTPIMTAGLRPIRAREAEIQKNHRAELARYEEAKKAKQEVTPPEPAIRYVVNDATVEKLGELLASQNRGLLVVHDELSGWIGAHDRYSGGKRSGASDRAFWLTAYNGGPFTIDRVQRGSLFVENLSVSFVGGIQPRRLKQLADLSSDGLLQRFLPVMMGPASPGLDQPDDGVIKEYETLVGYILHLAPTRLLLSPEARAATAELHRFLHDLEQVGGLGDNFSAFVGKLAGVHGSLALLLHIVRDPADARFTPVGLEAVEAASRIIREFLIPHALAFYGVTADAPDLDHLRAIASYILTSSKDRFTTSDFTSGVHSLRGMSTWEVHQRISPLVAGGWLEEETASAPARAWTLRPKVRERLWERRHAEQERKAKAVEMIGSLARARRPGAVS